MLIRCLVGILLLFPSFVSAQRCLENWACWEVRQVNGQYEFWVSNLKPHVFTASLDVKVRNLRDSRGVRSRYEKTAVILGNSEQRLLTLYVVEGSRQPEYRDIFYWTPGDIEAKHDSNIEYVAPFAQGDDYPLVQGFGGGWSHRGASKYAVDFAMPVGTQVHAARDGIVVKIVSHHNQGGSHRRYAEFANYIVVLHDDGTTGEYYHLMKDGVTVRVDQKVQAGQHIGYSGNTGFSSIPHLHFAVYRPQPMGDFESLPFEFEDNRATKRSWW